jgi:hypothetical protein
MDAEKFDRLTQALGAGLSRRGALRAALGTTVLGSLGLNQSDEAGAEKKKENKKKKCLKKAGPCETCNKKGKKKPKANGTGCSTPQGSGQCANGACILQSPPVPPSPPPPGNTTIGVGNPCTQGGTPCTSPAVCGKAFGGAPTRCCNPPGTSCSAGTASLCCNNGCNSDTMLCACKSSGTACDDDNQCCSRSCPQAASRTCV